MNFTIVGSGNQIINVIGQNHTIISIIKGDGDMDKKIKRIEEVYAPEEIIKIGNTVSVCNLSTTKAYKTEKEIEACADRIVKLWVNAYIGGRFNKEKLEELGPYEMISIFK